MDETSMVTKKRHFIVVEKFGDKGMEYQRDEVLLECENDDGSLLFSTSLNGTILIRPNGKCEFGPNCPKGVAVYDKF